MMQVLTRPGGRCILPTKGRRLALPIRATANTGASQGDMREALLHVAISADVPRATHAIKIAKDTFTAREAAHD